MLVKAPHIEEKLLQVEESTCDYELLTDEQLWALFKTGDKAVLAYLYEQHFYKLYDYGYKISPDEALVKDCIQELFVTIWKNKSNLSSTNNIRHYLYKSLRRKIYAQLKKQQHPLFRKDIPSNYHFTFTLSYENELVHEQMKVEQKEAVLKALNQLPPRQKEVLYLRYYQNLSIQEVSTVMGLTVDSTYVFISRAISHIKKHIDRVF